jgi:hypothetical protein
MFDQDNWIESKNSYCYRHLIFVFNLMEQKRLDWDKEYIKEKMKNRFKHIVIE